MSRAHAVAPATATSSPAKPGHLTGPAGPRTASRTARPAAGWYVERALLLWPRLDRARLRKLGDDPVRIAQMVAHRSSQPNDVILAMLTRTCPAASSPPPGPERFRGARSDGRADLRVVRTEETGEIRIRTLQAV
jgi:hypothetical protein